jgi:hypothetical protein
MKKGYVTFHSVSDSLKFEKILKETELDIQLVPVPRQISSSCGVAAMFNPDREQAVRDFIEDNKLKISNIHLLQQAEKKKSLLERFK